MDRMNVLIAYQGMESIRHILEDAAPDAHLHFIAAEEAGELLPQVDILWGRPTEDILEVADSLQWVQVNSAGVNQLPLQLLSDRDIILTNARGMHGPAIADHVMGLILAHSRKLPLRLHRQSQRRWERDEGAWELQGDTLGIIGLGGIGREVARRARPFGLQVLGTRRSGADLPEADGVYPNHQMHQMLPECDYLVICCPLTPDTEGLIGAEELHLLPDHAYLVNIARGAVIDEEEMVRALQSDRLGGAGLDVFAEEPLPPESPLWDIDNVIITPHVAGQQKNRVEKVARRFARNLRRWRAGRDLCWVVDYSRGY